MDARTADAGATSSRKTATGIDVVERFQKPLLELLVDFGDEILDCVREHCGVSVDAVRSAVIGPLREELRRRTEHATGDMH